MTTAMTFRRTVPMLRILDERKAREFYLGFLGFAVDWEARFEPAAPLYMQVSRGEVVLHLSEHHGDGTPGTHVRVEMTGVEELQRELIARDYGYGRPGVEEMPWGERVVRTYDPFGNQIHFCERIAAGS